MLDQTEPKDWTSQVQLFLTAQTLEHLGYVSQIGLTGTDKVIQDLSRPQGPRQ